MAQASPIADRPPTAGGPLVRLEVRARGRPAVYEVGDGGFLVGTVPGCDLRLPGAELPPVLCLIARQPGGARLRKLAPMAPLTVNGQAVVAAALADGDRIGVGGAEIVASIEGAPGQPADERERQLEEQSAQLLRERTEWQQRKADIEQECQRQQSAAVEMQQRLRKQERELAEARAEFEQLRRAGGSVEAAASKQYHDAQELKRELAEIKQQLVQKFQQQGLGDAVSSWVGTGQNQAITSEQIQKVLGEKVAQWAAQLKLPKDAIGAHLAKLLPALIDRLTPHGKVPDAAQLETEVDTYLSS